LSHLIQMLSFTPRYTTYIHSKCIIRIPSGSASYVLWTSIHSHSFVFPSSNFIKKKQLGLTLTKMNWLLRRKAQLSITNKLLLYKTILKPIWTYGIQLWGTASTSDIEILERFQSKVLRMIVDTPWYVPNSLIRRDLSWPTVKEEIRRYSSHYGDRLRTHPNHFAVNLLRLPDNRRLRRFLPTDLPDRF
jgi:hypothetical protein